MEFATTLPDETLDGLATRVYELGKEPTATLMRTARRALTDANPYLKSTERVPAGTVVAVPEIDGAPYGAATQAADQTATSVLAAQLVGMTGLMQATVQSELDAQAADARADSAFLQSARAKQLARSDDRFKEALPTLVKTATARADDARALKNYTKEAFAQLEADLAELAKAFG